MNLKNTTKRNSPAWPESLSYEAFLRFSPASDDWICQTVYSLRGDQISVRNQRIGLEKLGRILKATFKLSSKTGFHSMSLRELSRESDISMGGLYAYIGSKEELANLIEHVLGVISSELTDLATAGIEDTRAKLIALIYAHIYLSEQLQPWFYFVYMESKSLSEQQKEKAKRTELDFEARFVRLVGDGIKEGIFNSLDINLCASAIISLLQDWHLKSWKHRGRKISPQRYAEFITELVMARLDI
ncbi:TetR/AcrR family transcriptional regulator [Halioxenophilus sp. WMMB6]|uniref:TetR/AcrR family transcriptional regulator n=1 Tax=Halioxenophilus sp. WMMB6 TaxID=3073815 RepID=UPI00295EA4ED|nr:TetR/AcrR family transcriptional regulator [Halioxenophilus sp. WMMB6]